MSARSIYFRGQADACRQHANRIMDTEMRGELRELADKFIVRALEIESKSRTKLSGPR
jgi:hypothetical protein